MKFNLSKYFGKGLNEQLKNKEANKITYDSFTVEKLDSILEDLCKEAEARDNTKLYTGKKGAINYLRSFYQQAMIWSGLPKDKWEARVEELVERDSKDMEEGAYSIDIYGIHYHPSNNT